MYSSLIPETLTGFVKVPRRILQSESWKNPQRVWLLLLILFHAENEEREVTRCGYNIHLHQGQLLTTVSDLAEGMRVSAKVIRGHLDVLEREGFIMRESCHNRFTIITMADFMEDKPEKISVGIPMEQPTEHPNDCIPVNYESQRKTNGHTERLTDARSNGQTFIVEETNNRMSSLLLSLNDKESSLFKQLASDTEVISKLDLMGEIPLKALESFLESCIERQKVAHQDYADIRSHLYSWVAYLHRNAVKSHESACNPR